ncbi:MAG: alcohol dehydrogenase catalytic domain-containing protein, partial [Lactobacillaceae bacterium]
MVDTMKAAVLMSAGDVQYKDVPVPEISDDDFLIKVAYSGVCGSDLPRSQKENGARLYPLILGHEFSG